MAKGKKPRAKKASVDWIDALAKQKLEVESAADALQVKGWLDTGNYALNWAIGGRLLRGYPLGHTVEIFGDPSTGKSYLVTRAIAMVQRANGYALLDDTEGAYNLSHIGTLGVNVRRLAYRRSPTVSAHFETAQAFVAAYKAMGGNVPGLLAVDSLAQLSTEHEIEVGLEKRDMTKAAELKAFFRIMGPQLMQLPVVHISTNHVIANIGNPFAPRTTPGGGGPKFMSSVRLDLRAISKIKSGPDAIGTICTVFVDKNRIVAPWKKIQLAIPFDRPISKASGLVPLLLAMGVLQAVGDEILYEGAIIGKAFTQKDRFLDQDEVGEQLLDQFPEILEETDERLEAASKEPQPQEEERIGGPVKITTPEDEHASAE